MSGSAVAELVDGTRTVDPSEGAAPAVTVLVADDHELVLCGMRLMLGREPWVERCLLARDPDGVVAVADRFRPQVALIDVRLGACSAQEICLAVRQASPQTRMVLMTPADRVSPRTIAAIGAVGYVSKGWDKGAIVRAVRQVGAGRVPSVAAPRRDSGLSARQQEILHLLSMGGTNDEIARALHLSHNTVKQHASALYRKLQVRNRAEAIGRAQAMGLLG